jgi:hypothetical protein
MMSRRCGKRLGWEADYFGGQQNDPEACGRFAPYHVTERMVGDLGVKCDTWLCETHYAQWLEHDFSLQMTEIDIGC